MAQSSAIAKVSVLVDLGGSGFRGLGFRDLGFGGFGLSWATARRAYDFGFQG